MYCLDVIFCEKLETKCWGFTKREKTKLVPVEVAT